MPKREEGLMLLTERAASKVKAVLEEEEAKGAYLRVSVAKGCSCCGGVGYALAIERQPKEDDIITESEGVRILMSEDHVGQIKGSVMDYVEAFPRTGFRINNPKAKSSCGCGH